MNKYISPWAASRPGFVGVLVLVLVFGFACSDDPPPPRGVGSTPDSGIPDTSPPGQDTSPGEEDVRREEPEGFMHGQWHMHRDDTDEHIYSFEFVHVEGQARVVGTYTFLLLDESGSLNPGSWDAEEQLFSIGWTAAVQGVDQSFSVFNGVASTDDLLLARFNDRFAGSTYGVKLVRVP